MGWEVITAKTTTRNYAPKVRLKNGYVYFNVGSYNLLDPSKGEDSGIYVRFLWNDSTKAYYVSYASKDTPGAIRIPKGAKSTKADLLEQRLEDKFGKGVKRFDVDRQAIKHGEYYCFMLIPTRNG